MRPIQIIITVLVLGFLTGCQHQAIPGNLSNTENVFLTVDFFDNQTLRYRFLSGRDITIEWDSAENQTDSEQSFLSKSSESMEMVVAYTPIKIDPYGLTTIEATCESVTVKRSDGSQTDAVTNLTGKSYTFAIGPTGKIEQNSQLDELIKEIGQKAFLPDTGTGKIKEPDMIGDFIALQWFLWDSISSIDNASQGIRIGQNWQSKLSVPTPMVSRLARDVTYRLEEIRRGKNGRLAVISSTYNKTDSAPQSWPIPYTGSFQMKGKFGILGGYKFLDIQGRGEELFNIDLGRTEQYDQKYSLHLQASIPLGIDVSADITIEQNLAMTLIEDRNANAAKGGE